MRPIGLEFGPIAATWEGHICVRVHGRSDVVVFLADEDCQLWVALVVMEANWTCFFLQALAETGGLGSRRKLIGINWLNLARATIALELMVEGPFFLSTVSIHVKCIGHKIDITEQKTQKRATI